ncbi:single-stranded DNA-binding protein [Staphylococcus epidermidis Scl25]|jgi:single-stranded DNA-binding protein|uniref:Single-stranded DNA-binding protein n=5 Tax=Staphylococcus TaxID=1279 RepID=Q5HMC5_STAEQ|nr:MULTISPECIES: single-stranded DNA-binding protein [Staphylococcus]EID37286.1 single-stranded DNA-binding protein [Staphylococcus epidermidis IS-250]EON82756.1 ssDNA-binding protein [Staphylococcus epidermidis 41tr]EON83910.1 ssDNA-binding protein [Staphylococcus epidermidis 528m]EON86984.1 ssDNA-binding protein [Staphylococcus epidermidis 36-1]ETJ12882.1 MAG: Single-stranded DNA-binding protein [Staphylococcus sp. DORA_6_22]CVY60844.1 single-stranded DNA-binding protein ssb [Streptococcus 
MLNKIVIVGRMTKDAQIYEKEDNKIATFCVATERNYKDDINEISTDYLLCKAFGKTATNIEKYTSQGTLVGITGQMRSRKYEKEGQTHFVTELYVETIKFMSPKNKNNETPSDNQFENNTYQPDDLEIIHI